MMHSAACSIAVWTTSLTFLCSFGNRLTNSFVNSSPKSSSVPVLGGVRLKKGTLHAKSIGASLVRPWYTSPPLAIFPSSSHTNEPFFSFSANASSFWSFGFRPSLSALRTMRSMTAFPGPQSKLLRTRPVPESAVIDPIAPTCTATKPHLVSASGLRCHSTVCVSSRRWRNSTASAVEKR